MVLNKCMNNTPPNIDPEILPSEEAPAEPETLAEPCAVAPPTENN